MLKVDNGTKVYEVRLKKRDDRMIGIMVEGYEIGTIYEFDETIKLQLKSCHSSLTENGVLLKDAL